MIDPGPTGSPGVDALLATARTLASEPELKESLQFSRHVEELQTFRRTLEKQFRDSLRFYPRNALLLELEGQLDREFERFRGGGRRLESYLEKGQPEDLEVGCQRVHQAVSELQTLAARLRAQEDTWKQEYGVGLAGELRFLVTQTMEGKIPYQQCAQVLDKSLDACRQMEQAIAQVKPENDQVAETLEPCLLALASLSRALQRASQSLRMQHSWEIEERLADLLDSVEKLGSAHRQLMQALYPPVTCPRCGAEQPGDRPNCSSCSARLPLPASSLPPSVTADLPARFQAFAELDGKLELYRSGQIELTAVLGWIDQLRQRLSLGKRQMQADSQLEPGLKASLLEATDSTEKALASLKRALQENGGLDEAMELVRAAEDQMSQARELTLTEADYSTPNS